MYGAYQPHVLALHADVEGAMKSLPIKQHKLSLDTHAVLDALKCDNRDPLNSDEHIILQTRLNKALPFGYG